MPFPTHRPRRLRRNENWRRMVRENHLRTDDFVYPLFVVPGSGIRNPVRSMPSVFQLSIDEVVAEAAEVYRLGIPAVILFGIPAHKDAAGTEGYDPDGIVPQAIRAIKKEVPELLVWADVCLCEYTDHGHCGLLTPSGEVDNDSTVPLLAQASLVYAQAGADAVAPSDMMDGRIGAVREILDENDLEHVVVVSYAAKYSSGYYGPFRDAAESAPSFGDRRAYQMDPPNSDEAMTEIALDLDEGADIIMVKPAGPYLDIIQRARDSFTVPLAAYQVSGEFSMIKAAGANDWVDEKRVALESLLGIKRAGADIIITYFAKDAARWLAEG